MLLEALVRRFPALKSLSEATTGGRLTGHLSMAVAQVEDEFTEMSRAGRRFMGNFSTTAVVAVQAIPTTTASYFLFNNDPNRAYIIDSVTPFWGSGTAAAGGITIFGIVSPITATLPTAATGSAVGSCSAGGLVSKAILATGYTIPATSGMQQWGVVPGQQGQYSSALPTLGCSGNADVRGRFIIPPGQKWGLGLAVLAPAGTSNAFFCGINWHEAELDLE